MSLARMCLLLGILSSCVDGDYVQAREPRLRKLASADLDCPASMLTIVDLGKQRRGVEGCGKRRVYQLADEEWNLEDEGDALGAWPSREGTPESRRSLQSSGHPSAPRTRAFSSRSTRESIARSAATRGHHAASGAAPFAGDAAAATTAPTAVDAGAPFAREVNEGRLSREQEGPFRERTRSSVVRTKGISRAGESFARDGGRLGPNEGSPLWEGNRLRVEEGDLARQEEHPSAKGRCPMSEEPGPSRGEHG